MALGPTCPHLARCLSIETNADSGVCVVRVGVLARLAFAIITEAPASFVAIFALDVEARPDGIVYESTTEIFETLAAMGTNHPWMNTPAHVPCPWPLHGAILVGA